MGKSKLIIMGMVVLLIGLAAGWFLARYSLNPDFSFGSAASQGRCKNTETGTASGCGRITNQTACNMSNSAYDAEVKCHWVES